MSEATLSIRAHFDGSHIVPDEPVDLPVDAPLRVEVRKAAMVVTNPSAEIQKRLTALKSFTSLGENGISIPADKLRRENLYGAEER